MVSRSGATRKGRDARSAEARLYRAWYSTARWQRIRAHQLATEPLCRMCKAAGRITAATVCDHVEPHRGDPTRFWAGPFQSLCDVPPWRCHSSVKQSEESLGFSSEIGEDGLPVDPNHPFNSGKPAKVWGFSIPHGVGRSAIPVTLVCGPPAAGKSSYVRQHAAKGDTIIDFDEIRKKVGGTKWDQRPEINKRAYAYRDKVIRGLKDKRSGRAWLIVMAPTSAERRAWCEALGTTTPIMIKPSIDTCLAQMRGDSDRSSTASVQQQAIEEWYRAYSET